jgi:hypothetical protein
MNAKVSSWAKGVTGGFEALLAIPFIGGSIVVFSGWQALSLAFFLHLIAIVICIFSKTNPFPNVLGVVASIVGYVPVIGWLLHTVTAIVLLISAYKDSIKPKEPEHPESK